MRKRIIYQIDSFTREKFRGNPAGVVLHADGLDEKKMLYIARELNNSETAFLFAPDGHDCDGVIRYFTPRTEVPTCGHATIAAMVAKALEENLDSCMLRYKTRIGVLPFEIIKQHNDYQVIMTQGRFEQGKEFDANTTGKLLTALRLGAEKLDRRCPIAIASTGHSKVMIAIKSRQQLNDLEPDYSALTDLSRDIKCNGYFVFTFDSNRDDVLTFGRMFAPAVGINEDPVTGNANGPLGGYLVQNRLVSYSGNCYEFRGMQGEKIDRPGVVHVKVTIENDMPVLIQIRGDAVPVFRTEIEI